MLKNTDDFINVFKKLGIKKKDKISVGSSILKILKHNKNENFNPKVILTALKKIITKEGVVMVDAFSWDFCKTGTFDYYLSTNKIGSLAKIALSDKEFIRTRNPIYSFLVYGKQKSNIAKIEHSSCFSFDSPFGHIINNNGKYLLIDIDFRVHAYVHLAEQEVGIEHRFFKNFSGKYKNKKGKVSKINIEMYCRKLDSNIETFIDPKFKNHLKRNKALTEINKDGIIFTLIDAKIAHKLMVKDLKTSKKFIYPKNMK